MSSVILIQLQKLLVPHIFQIWILVRECSELSQILNHVIINVLSIFNILMLFICCMNTCYFQQLSLSRTKAESAVQTELRDKQTL